MQHRHAPTQRAALRDRLIDTPGRLARRLGLRPSFYFVLSLNNAGSTVLCQYLAGQVDGFLPPYGNAEGQMVPAVRAMMRDKPWNPDAPFDWAAIDVAWERLRREAGGRAFVEGSPPNIMRVGAIRRQFGTRGRYLFNIANPYLQISSTLFNYALPPLTADKLTGAVDQYVMKAARLRDAMAAHPDIPAIRYEAFCADPRVVNRALALPERGDTLVLGKGRWKRQPITDRTADCAAFLTTDELATVNARLTDAAALLGAFGYALHEPGSFRADPDAIAAGAARRARFEARTHVART